MVSEVSSYTQSVTTVRSPAIDVSKTTARAEVVPAQPLSPREVEKEQSQSATLPLSSKPGVASEEVNVLAVVKEMKDYVQNIQRDLEFTVDEESGRTIITVIDSETDEVIRQIPPEDLLYMVKALQENSANLFVEVKV